MVGSLRLLLPRLIEGQWSFEITTVSRCADCIEQARTGLHDLAILHANCLWRTPPLTLLEHVTLAIKNLTPTPVRKSSC